MNNNIIPFKGVTITQVSDVPTDPSGDVSIPMREELEAAVGGRKLDKLIIVWASAKGASMAHYIDGVGPAEAVGMMEFAKARIIGDFDKEGE